MVRTSTRSLTFLISSIVLLISIYALSSLAYAGSSDLTVESIWLEKASAPGVPVAGTDLPVNASFNIVASVKNLGQETAFGFYLDVYYDSDFGRGGPDNIAPGEVQEWYVGPLTARAGTHTTRWVVDPDNKIAELNESNNQKTLTFTIGQPVSTATTGTATKTVTGTTTTRFTTATTTTKLMTTTTLTSTTSANTATTQATVTSSTILTVTLRTTITTTGQGMVIQVTSNSSVSKLIFDSGRGLLNFTVSGPSGSHGFFDATIAKSLISGQPIVLIDRVQSPASVSQDANFWYIHVTYTHSQHQVTIGGSNTIPEFPSIPLLQIVLLFTIITLTRIKRET